MTKAKQKPKKPNQAKEETCVNNESKVHVCRNESAISPENFDLILMNMTGTAEPNIR